MTTSENTRSKASGSSLEVLERGLPVADPGDRLAQFLEQAGRELADALIVLDQQDAPTAGPPARSITAAPGRRRSGPDRRRWADRA
jgi:hypothetical protein